MNSPLSPKQLIKELKRIANDIDKTDEPSKSRIASDLKRLQTRICPIRRMAIPTMLEIDVTNTAKYEKMMNLLDDR